MKQGVVPATQCGSTTQVGHTQEAKKELVQIMDFADSESVFITPKPTRLIERILQISHVIPVTSCSTHSPDLAQPVTRS